MPSPLEEMLKLSPFIGNVMLYGDGRPFNVALVIPNAQALQTWAPPRRVTALAQSEAARPTSSTAKARS